VYHIRALAGLQLINHIYSMTDGQMVFLEEIFSK